MTRLYPLFVRVDRLRCVVIGGGPVAARKTRGLLSAGARVRLVAPDVHADLRCLLNENGIEWLEREASEQDLEDVDLVILATDDHDVNSRLERAARRNGALVNRADSPEDGTFHVPASVNRGDVAVAISTGGRSPAFARLLREEIESLLTDERILQLEAIARAREAAHARGIAASAERWRELLHDDAVLALVQTGRLDEAVEQIVERIEAAGYAGGAR